MTGNDGEIAQRYLERDFPEAAYIWSKKSRENTPSRYSVLGTSILRCFGIRRINDTIKAYTKAIVLDPSDFSLRMLRGVAYKMKAEHIRNSYFGNGTGIPQKSEELEEMLLDAIGYAERDFFSVFKFSKSPIYRKQTAGELGELEALKSI